MDIVRTSLLCSLFLLGGCLSLPVAQPTWVPGPDGHPMLRAEWTVAQMERARLGEDWREPEDELGFILNATFGGLR